MGRVSAEDQPGPERRRHLPGGRTRRIPLRRGSACRRASGEARGEPTALKAFDRLARFAKPLPRMACPLQILDRSEEHTSETPVTNAHLVCRLLLEKKKTDETNIIQIK